MSFGPGAPLGTFGFEHEGGRIGCNTVGKETPFGCESRFPLRSGETCVRALCPRLEFAVARLNLGELRLHFVSIESLCGDREQLPPMQGGPPWRTTLPPECSTHRHEAPLPCRRNRSRRWHVAGCDSHATRQGPPSDRGPRVHCSRGQSFDEPERVPLDVCRPGRGVLRLPRVVVMNLPPTVCATGVVVREGDPDGHEPVVESATVTR
jgi:hypothetical protein